MNHPFTGAHTGQARRGPGDRWRRALGGVLLAGLVSATLPVPNALAATDYDYVTRHIAGTGSSGCQSAPTQGTATLSEFCVITATARHANGDLYLIDQGYRLIYKVSNGVLSIVAGGGGTYGTSTDALNASFVSPYGGVLVGDLLYFTDPDDPKIYKMNVITGALTHIAGTGAFSSTPPYFLPTFGGPAVSTPLGYPMDLAVDPASGDVYIADAQGAIEKIDGTTGILSLVAGSPGSSTVPTTTPTPATSTKIWYPETLALAPDGTLFIGNPNFAGRSQMSAIYKVTPGGDISLFAGNGADANAVNGPALASPLNRLKSLRISPNGNLYAALDAQIVTIDRSGDLEVIAGGGPRMSSPAFDVPSLTSSMYQAMALSFGPDCSIYFNTGVARYIAQLESQQPCALAAPTATAGDGQATVTWPNPTSPGASAVTGYVVTPYVAGVAQTPVTFTSTATTQTLTGLVNGTAYTFTVSPVNAVGSGDGSPASNTATPTAPPPPPPSPAPAVEPRPAAPVITSAVGSGTTLTVAFTPPTNPGTTPITGYRLTVSGGDLTTPVVVNGTGSPLVARGLTAGQTYTLFVTALNGSGEGAASNIVTGRWDPSTVVADGVTRMAGGDRTGTAIAVSRTLFPGDGVATAAVLATTTTYADSIAGGRLASAIKGPLLLTPTDHLQSDVAGEVRRTVRPGGTVYVLGQTKALSQRVRDALAELDDTYIITRVGGADRYETAARIAEVVTNRTGNTDGPIYLASGANFPDGLAVAALAGKSGGVVLLTGDGTLPESTRAYLQQHDPSGARTTTVGGPAARAFPGAAASIVGPDRYATSALVAAAFDDPTMSMVGVASGADWPDALVGAAAMGMMGGPLLLTTPASMSPSSAAVVTDNADVRSVWLFGGPNAVSAGVQDELDGLLERP